LTAAITDPTLRTLHCGRPGVRARALVGARRRESVTEIGVPDPVEPEIEVIPAVEPVPGPFEVPGPLPKPERTPERVPA
jgi:hypothetical protein